MLKKNILLTAFAGMLLCITTAAQKTKTSVGRKQYTPPAKSFNVQDHDSSYYQTFERHITARFYTSQKYGGIGLERATNISRTRYTPNILLALGVGVTYETISVNLAYGFLNTSPGQGKTKSFDVQAHIYERAWTVDVLGQFYKGYYLAPKGTASASVNNYYTRPDMRMLLLGASAYRLMNPSRFSYRAALFENEKQKKSAGSILLGAEAYYGSVKADSAFVPSSIAENYEQKGVRKLNFFKIGPGIGYVYTFIFEKNFYLTGSLCASVSFDYSDQYIASNKVGRFALNKGFIYRLVAGYDNNNWNANISLVGNQVTVTGAESSGKYLFSAGNFRFTLAKRIKPGKKLTQKLQPVDKLIQDVKGLVPSKQ